MHRPPIDDLIAVRQNNGSFETSHGGWRMKGKKISVSVSGCIWMLIGGLAFLAGIIFVSVPHSLGIANGGEPPEFNGFGQEHLDD